jgi:hypothetical protein
MHRDTRRFLVVILVALTVALAGCGGSGNATPADGGDGAADGGAANDGGADDSDSSDGSDGAAVPTAAAGADGTATGTASATLTATRTTAGPGTPTPTATPNASDPPGTDESAGPLLENHIRSPEEFRYRVETSTEDGNYVQVGRWHGEDHYASVDSIGGMDQSYEIYSVDGAVYTVIGGRCIDMDSPQFQNPRNATQGDSSNLSKRPVGTDTIDGETVYVYEVQTDQPGGPYTYYVDAKSGYTLRMEFSDTTIEYWDFGSVEPVESPC